MKMTSDLTNVSSMDAVPADTYPAHVSGMERGMTRGDPQAKDPKTGQLKPKPSVAKRTLDWTIDEGPYMGRIIKFDELVIGGDNPFRLAEFLEAGKVPWSCDACKSAEMPREFERQKRDGKTYYHCPDCHSPMRVTYEDELFNGTRMRLVLSVEKAQNSDRDINRVKKYLPAS